MGQPNPMLDGLTPLAVTLLMWRNIPSKVDRLERLSWMILGGVAVIGTIGGWKLFGSPHAAAAIHVAAKVMRWT